MTCRRAVAERMRSRYDGSEGWEARARGGLISEATLLTTGHWSCSAASCGAGEGSRGGVFVASLEVVQVLGASLAGNGGRLTKDYGRRRRGGIIACAYRKNGNGFKVGARALGNASAAIEQDVV